MTDIIILKMLTRSLDITEWMLVNGYMSHTEALLCLWNMWCTISNTVLNSAFPIPDSTQMVNFYD